MDKEEAADAERNACDDRHTALSNGGNEPPPGGPFGDTVIYDERGRGWLLPHDWTADEVFAVLGDVRLAFRLADSRGQRLQQAPVMRQPLGQRYMPGSRATDYRRIRLPNWPGGLSVNDFLHLADVDGLPVAWVPDAVTLTQWVRAPDYDARVDLLEARLDDVLAHAGQVLAQVTVPGLATFQSLLCEGQRLIDDGHFGGAQALASVVLTTLIEHPGGASLAAARKRAEQWRKVAARPVKGPAPDRVTHVGAAAAHLAYVAALAQNRPPNDVPSRYNRHASVHWVSGVQYSQANALVAHLLATSLLRQAEADWGADPVLP